MLFIYFLCPSQKSYLTQKSISQPYVNGMWKLSHLHTPAKITSLCVVRPMGLFLHKKCCALRGQMHHSVGQRISQVFSPTPLVQFRCYNEYTPLKHKTTSLRWRICLVKCQLEQVNGWPLWLLLIGAWRDAMKLENWIYIFLNLCWKSQVGKVINMLASGCTQGVLTVL